MVLLLNHFVWLNQYVSAPTEEFEINLAKGHSTHDWWK